MATFKKIVMHTTNDANGFRKIMLLFILGFFIIFLGIIILVVAAVLSGGSTNFGALIFIGPIPIVIGAGPEATLMILLAIVLAVLAIIMFLVLRRKPDNPNI